MTTIINGILYALLTFAVIVIVLAIITTIAYFVRRDRLTTGHDGE